VIKLNSIAIHEMRGIRTILLPFNARSFVISGDNGTGKSGVVDAIEFGLTGDISRLSGRARGNVSTKAHGPHVTHRSTPEFSEVTLEVLLTDSNAVVTLSRNMKSPGKYKLDPDTPYNRGILDEVGLHPEIVLSRREIINLIITQATDRSAAVQTLLKLDGIDKTRKALGTASTKLKDEAETASSTLNTRTGELIRHLGIEKLDGASVIAFVNEKRASLGLGPLDSLTDSASITDGLDDAALSDTFNKESALKDIDAAQVFLSTCVSTNEKTCESLVIDLCEIEENPSLLDLIDAAELVTMGIELVDAPECPLCDLAWDDIDALKEHLDEKLRNSASAVAIAERLIANGKILAGAARKTQSHIASIEGLPSELVSSNLAQSLKDWDAELEIFISDAASLSGLRKMQTQFSTGWPAIPPDLSTLILALRSAADAKTDQSAPAAAASALGIAGERFAGVKKAESAAAAATKAADIANVLHETYLIVSANVLESIYEVVQQDFSKFYKMINGEDEEGFKASFKQDGGKLELEVEFYGEGTFPPNAYHSEGHQDGMGVCLYLALMRQLLPNHFDFAVLDDVVMSIDAGHRKRFLRLLQSEFTNTQFIITTHDRFWAKQIFNVLDKPIGGVIFTGWSVETGPIHHADDEVWMRVDEDLAKNDVSSAAQKLRTYLEFLCSELADNLGAEVKYRADGSYELGDLWSPIVSRYGRLLGLGAKSAAAFDRSDLAELVKDRKSNWSVAMTRYGDENWVINKVLHHNEWANATAEEFREVVDSVKAVLSELRCHNSKCESWLEVSPRRGESHSLACRCGSVSLNLLTK